MYDVILKNGNVETLIHNHCAGNTGAKLDVCSISQSVNAINSLSFSICPENPGFETVHSFSTLVTVINRSRNRVEFSGRVLQITPQMDSGGQVSKTVVCEDTAGYLKDSLQTYMEPTQFVSDTDSTAMQKIIDVILTAHNQQVEEYKQIERGNVTVAPAETTEGLTFSTSYLSTWDAIINNLVNVYGGQIQVRESGGKLYLDYAEQLGTVRATSIELAKNMNSVQQEIDPTTFITRLVPLGAQIVQTTTDPDGNLIEETTEERLSIVDVTENGENYIESSAAGTYGVIYGTHMWDEITDPAELRDTAMAWLEENNRIALRSTVDAFDLSLLGLDLDDFALYDSYPLKNDLIGISGTYQIVGKNVDVIEPYNSTITLGDKTVLLSDQIAAGNASVSDIQQSITKVETNIKNDISSTQSSLQSSITNLIQTTDALEARVEQTTISKSEYEEFQQQVKNILQMDADGTTMIFQTINQAISDVLGVTNTNYEEITKYIRFSAEGIELGEVDNPVLLKIGNDRISFLRNGLEVAYMAESKLYIMDAEFLHSIIVGALTIVPRDNGNISFKKNR